MNGFVCVFCWCAYTICFKTLQHFHFRVKQMDKRWRRYSGFFQVFRCYIDSVCDLYVCVTHKRLVIQCRLTPCCLMLGVTEDVICHINVFELKN